MHGIFPMKNMTNAGFSYGEMVLFHQQRCGLDICDLGMGQNPGT
jgi:hypothetical protein